MNKRLTGSLKLLSLVAVATLAAVCPIIAYAQEEKKVSDISATDSKAKLAVATFGGGCFWCTEAVFENIERSHGRRLGYAGGKIPELTYEQVCTGRTGHAEVCQIHYNPAELPLKNCSKYSGKHTIRPL